MGEKFFIAFILTVLISALIGYVFALHFVFMMKDIPISGALIKGISVGGIIGALSHLAFNCFYLNLKQNRVFISFLSIVIIIGAGTFVGAYISGVKSLFTCLLLALIADVIGLIVAVLFYKFNIWQR